MTDIDMYMPKGGVQGHAGQATMVEASRAMEQVRAQVVLARQFPRDVTAAIARITEMFKVQAMAERSFFSYPKGGGKNVTGSTIHLAKAVAQAWGNIDCNISELSRSASQSEMQAWAWDLETNVRVSTTFIVQHAMDVKAGLKELTDLRSIYENNANMANRRLRAQIESVIPAYVMDIAKDVATQTLRGTGTKPLPVRIAAVIDTFTGLGVEQEQLEQERGRPSGKWTEIDLGHLRTLGMTISRGEMTVAEAFPPVEITPEQARPADPVQNRPDPVWEQPDEPPFEESAEWRPAAVPGHPDPDRKQETVKPVWPKVAQPGGGE